MLVETTACQSWRVVQTQCIHHQLFFQFCLHSDKRAVYNCFRCLDWMMLKPQCIWSCVLVFQKETINLMHKSRCFGCLHISCTVYVAVTRKCTLSCLTMTLVMTMMTNVDGGGDDDETLCRFVGVSVVDMEFLAIDFNPCPKSDGNDPPNYFYNVSRCKPSTVVSSLFSAVNCINDVEWLCHMWSRTYSMRQSWFFVYITFSENSFFWISLQPHRKIVYLLTTLHSSIAFISALTRGHQSWWVDWVSRHYLASSVILYVNCFFSDTLSLMLTKLGMNYTKVRATKLRSGFWIFA